MADNFLSLYRTYSSGNEAHPTYHSFAGLVALSAIVGRRVWLDMGPFVYSPNLYVVLVGPSGNRKTTAMTPAKNIIRALGLPHSAECVTKEKLVLDIAEKETMLKDMPVEYKKYAVFSPMTCIVTELSEFLGGGGLGMINFLVTIYDQDYYDIRTKNKGDSVIQGPYLCLLACTTPDWITIYLKQDVISGGFSRRAIFVYESTKGSPIPIPKLTKDMELAWLGMMDLAKKIQTVRGPMQWDPEALKFYENWYRQNFNRPAPHPMLVGYYESKHAQLLKIATLVSLSESVDKVIHQRHLEFALALLGLAEVNMAKVFAGLGRNELSPVANKVVELLRAQPPSKKNIEGLDLPQDVKLLPEKQIRSMFFNDASWMEMDQILKQLDETGKIERMTTQKPPIRVYIRLIE